MHDAIAEALHSKWSRYTFLSYIQIGNTYQWHSWVQYKYQPSVNAGYNDICWYSQTIQWTHYKLHVASNRAHHANAQLKEICITCTKIDNADIADTYMHANVATIIMIIPRTSFKGAGETLVPFWTSKNALQAIWGPWKSKAWCILYIQLKLWEYLRFR